MSARKRESAEFVHNARGADDDGHPLMTEAPPTEFWGCRRARLFNCWNYIMYRQWLRVGLLVANGHRALEELIGHGG